MPRNPRPFTTTLLAAAIACGTCLLAGTPWQATAAEPPAQPPPADRAQPDGQRRPPRPAGVSGAIDELKLSDEQKQKAAPIVQDYRQKERQAREALLQQMKDVLTPPQYQQLSDALQREGPPPRPRTEGDREPASRPPAPQTNARPAAAPAATAPAALPPAADGSVHVPLTFAGGDETDPRDHGRPVVLIAAALDVPADVFRDAFTRVTPASGGREPEPEQVRKNKRALLDTLAPRGVTNDRLDTVSNYYRYNASKGQTWRHAPAAAYATVRNGVVTGFTITAPGAGYSSPPKITVEGFPNLHPAATLVYGTDLETNGSVKEITLGK